MNVPRQSSVPLADSPVRKNFVFQSLSENVFLKEVKLICDKSVPDWRKYAALYKNIGANLCISHNARTPGGDTKKDAFTCLKLLADILICERSPLLADIVHLLSKHNVLRARNEAIVAVSQDLAQQRAAQRSSRVALDAVEQTIIIYRREQACSKVSMIQAYCIAVPHYEGSNACCIHEVYKRIQLSKFPTISEKLGQFLRNKRESARDGDLNQSEPDTPTVPQSLQKRVKMTITQKPAKISPNSNESVLTPRDTVRSCRSQLVTQVSQAPSQQQVPYTQPPLLASQMKQLNDASSTSKFGLRGGRPLMPAQDQTKHP